MRLAAPIFLVLLVVVPVVLLRPLARAGGATLLYPTLGRLRVAGVVAGRRDLGWLGALRAAALLLVVVALARPQLPGGTSARRTSGIDVLLTIDVSSSMKGQDFSLAGRRVSRLDAVRSVVRGFVEGRRNDRLGMVVFAEHAFTLCPLTLNYDVLLGLMDDVQFGMAGETTAIGNALARSVQRLKDSDGKTKVVILLSDGVSNAGNVTVADAITAAQAYGVRVYTIAIGTGERTRVPVTDESGATQVIEQEVRLDEDELTAIAAGTGGRFFRATDTDALAGVYSEIDGLEQAPSTGEIVETWRELFPWVLLVAAGLVLVEALLARTRFLRIP